MENSSLKSNENLNLHEVKRVESVKQKIKFYQQQKLTIKDALSNLDKTPRNKIVFETEDDINNAEQYVDSKKSVKQTVLFDSDNEEDFSFQLKEQFQGENGEQLFKLQSKFKGDKRFALDSRFIEKSEKFENFNINPELSLEQEKKNDIDILEKVLGTNLKTNDRFKQNISNEKQMLRFDPTQREHLQQFQITPQSKSKKLKKTIKQTLQLDGEKEQQPQVSKDVFYKVSNDLKNNFQNQNQFSLITMYSREGANTDMNSTENDDQSVDIKNKDKLLLLENNPFRYDSSEDELEEAEEKNTYIPNQDSSNTGVNAQFLLEPFFFKCDDYRFQDGTDFVNRIAFENNPAFLEQRRNLKNIVKAKVKNSVRKNNPFKRKLGGNRKKKNIRIKRALKR